MNERNEVDYRDCLELAGTIAEAVECYDSDDLTGHIANVVLPFVAEMERLKDTNADLLAACKKALHLVEENNKVIVKLVGSFGLLDDLRRAIDKATAGGDGP